MLRFKVSEEYNCVKVNIPRMQKKLLNIAKAMTMKNEEYQPQSKHVCFLVSGKKILSKAVNVFTADGGTCHAEERALRCIHPKYRQKGYYVLQC